MKEESNKMTGHALGSRGAPPARGAVDAATMRGRVCVVTGGNRGIGKATALGLARLGATVVILARDADRGARASDEIRLASGNENVSLVIADLGSFASIRAAAFEIDGRHAEVHVLLNNAGVNLTRRATSADGHEMTLAVNHLAPFLLTHLLLPSLRAGAPSRIINVTSKFERLGRIAPHDLQSAHRYNATRAYAQSKLATVMFTYDLAERLRGTGITVNCVHPGLVATDLMRDWPRWMRRLWEPFLRTPAQAARTLVHLASAPAHAEVTGRYFEPGPREARSSRRSRDVEARARLWRASAELTGVGGN